MVYPAGDLYPQVGLYPSKPLYSSYRIIIMGLDSIPHTITSTVQELSTTTYLSGSTDSFSLTLRNEDNVYSYIEKGCH